MASENSLCQHLSRSNSLKQYENPGHGNKLLNFINEQLQTGSNCDIVIQLRNESIKAHRLVICAFSGYFASKMKNAMAESDQVKIILPDNLDSASVKAVIGFAYSGTVEINGDNVQDLLTTAKFLQARGLEKACCDFLMENLDASNCLGMMKWAEKVGYNRVLESAITCASRNFTQVTQAPEWLSMSDSIFLGLLDRPKIYVESAPGVLLSAASQEKYIYQSAKKYISNDLEERKHLLSKVMQKIYLPVLSEFELKMIQEDLKEMDATEDCFELLQQAEHGNMKSRPPRAFAYRITCFSGPYLGGRGQNLSESLRKSKVESKNEYICKMIIWTRPWDCMLKHIRTTIVAGLRIVHSTGKQASWGDTNCKDVHEISLKPDERFVRLDTQPGLYSLTVYTSHGRTFGPYGDIHGHPACESGRIGEMPKLVGVGGWEASDREGSLILTGLIFSWEYYEFTEYCRTA